MCYKLTPDMYWWRVQLAPRLIASDHHLAACLDARIVQLPVRIYTHIVLCMDNGQRMGDDLCV